MLGLKGSGQGGRGTGRRGSQDGDGYTQGQRKALTQTGNRRGRFRIVGKAGVAVSTGVS